MNRAECVYHIWNKLRLTYVLGVRQARIYTLTGFCVFRCNRAFSAQFMGLIDRIQTTAYKICIFIGTGAMRARRALNFTETNRVEATIAAFVSSSFSSSSDSSFFSVFHSALVSLVFFLSRATLRVDRTMRRDRACMMQMTAAGGGDRNRGIIKRMRTAESPRSSEGLV